MREILVAIRKEAHAYFKLPTLALITAYIDQMR